MGVCGGTLRSQCPLGTEALLTPRLRTQRPLLTGSGRLLSSVLPRAVLAAMAAPPSSCWAVAVQPGLQHSPAFSATGPVPRCPLVVSPQRPTRSSHSASEPTWVLTSRGSHPPLPCSCSAVLPGSPGPLRPVEVTETLAQGGTCSSSGPETTFCRRACRSWRAGVPISLPGSSCHSCLPLLRWPRQASPPSHPRTLLLRVHSPPAPPWRAPWAVVRHWLPSQSPPKRMTPGGAGCFLFPLLCTRMLLAPGRDLVPRGSQGRKLWSACTSVLPTCRSPLLSAPCSRARPLQACAPTRGDAGSVPGWVVWPRGVSRRGRVWPRG